MSKWAGGSKQTQHVLLFIPQNKRKVSVTSLVQPMKKLLIYPVTVFLGQRENSLQLGQDQSFSDGVHYPRM